MIEQDEVKIWKVRTIKDYPEAHNHLLVGKVLQITDSYVRMHCITYHFGMVRGARDVQIGEVMVRVVPWSRIEIINELPRTFEYSHGSVIAEKEGEVLFEDNRHQVPITPMHR